MWSGRQENENSSALFAFPFLSAAYKDRPIEPLLPVKEQPLVPSSEYDGDLPKLKLPEFVKHILYEKKQPNRFAKNPVRKV